MASDPKVWRLAQLVVEKHGDEALAVVTERALGRFTVQDYPSATLWTRVAEAVHTILPHAKPERRSVWRTQAPLKELMDDPLMSVVVQDDEGRRREVHDVLRGAKRKIRRDES